MKKTLTALVLAASVLITGSVSAQDSPQVEEIEEQIEENNGFAIDCTVLQQEYALCIFPLEELETGEENDEEQEELMQEVQEFIEQVMADDEDGEDNEGNENNSENENNTENDAERPPWYSE